MSNQYVCRLSLRQLTKMQIQWKFQLINCSFLFGSFQQTILSKYRANFVFHWFFFLWMLIKLDEVFLRYQQRIAFIRGIRPNQQIEPFYRHQKPSEFSAGNTETQLCIHSRAHTTIFKLTSIDIRKTFISFEMASRGLHHRAEWTQKVNNSKKTNFKLSLLDVWEIKSIRCAPSLSKTLKMFRITSRENRAVDFKPYTNRTIDEN